MAYPIAKRIIPPIYKLWLGKVDGMENLPKGPFIVAANHTIYYDALLLPCIISPALNKQFRAWVNSYYWKSPITRVFLDSLGGIPVYVGKEPDAKKKNKESFRMAVKCLKKGEIIMIFPEGTRNDGKLKKAYTGTARLALTAKVPVLPCGIIGADKVLPKGNAFPRLARCKVRIGRPLHFDKYYGKNTEKAYEQVTRIIMKAIGRLTGQKYNH